MARKARVAQWDDDAYVADLDASQTRAQRIAENAAALARYRGPVRRLPTIVKLKCHGCGHGGAVRVAPGKSARFKCSKCGARSAQTKI